MRYPVAYRSGARKFRDGSFQEPAREPAPGPYKNPMKPPYKAPPKPDNDPYPRPDNDNVPGRGRWEHPRFPELPAWPGFPPAIADAAMSRILPPQARQAWNVGRLIFDAHEFPNYRLQGEIEMPPGWSRGCGPVTPGLAYDQETAFFQIGNSTVCGLNEQALDNPSAVPGNWSIALFAKARYVLGNPNLKRWFDIAWFSRTSGNAMLRYHVPVQPSVFPHAIPEPLPATVKNPLPATISPPVGNEVPANRPWPGALPRKAPGIYFRPVASNAPARWPQPGNAGKPHVVVAPPTVTNPVRTPPGPGVKERKFRAAPGALVGALGMAAGLYENAKFANDILEAWYQALPKYLKEPGLRPDQKAKALYLNYDKIDLLKAMQGVLIAIVGEKAGAYIDRARRKTGDNLGLNMYISIPTGSAPRVY